MNAAVDGFVIDRVATVIQIAHHDHASTAITFRTSLLGACAIQLLAQVIKSSAGAAHALGFDDVAVKHKTHSVGHLAHDGSGSG